MTSPLGPSKTNREWFLRTTLAVLVAIAVTAALAFAVVQLGDDDAEIIGVARIDWNPDIDDRLGEGKSASVEVIEDGDDRLVFVFDVEALRPPVESEFLEVWLVDTDESGGRERLSVGVFDDIRTRLFTLPDGLDPREFDRIEFSLEPDDGEAAYSGITLVRGDLVWLVTPPD